MQEWVRVAIHLAGGTAALLWVPRALTHRRWLHIVTGTHGWPSADWLMSCKSERCGVGQAPWSVEGGMQGRKVLPPSTSSRPDPRHRSGPSIPTHSHHGLPQ